MKSTDFTTLLRKAAEADTAYLWGTFGNRLTEGLIDQKAAQYPGRYSAARQTALRKRATEGGTVWAFDCVGLIKGVLWGWTGDENKSYGGSAYASNGVPDISASGLFGGCREVSEDFTHLQEGEFLSLPGHIGVYLGDGTAVEATLDGGADGVVIRPVAGRGWQKHGKSPFLEYTETGSTDPAVALLHVQTVGLRIREALTFSGGRPTGREIAFCPPGGDMEILGFLPGIRPDGYQWLRTRYNGVEGVSQYDSRCYYIYQKEE